MRKTIYLIGAMIVVLGAAHGYDMLSERIVESPGFVMFESPFFFWRWFSLVAQVLLAGLLLLLTWLALVKNSENGRVFWVFLVTGALILFAATTTFQRLWALLPPGRFPRQIFSQSLYLPRAPAHQIVGTAAFIACLGLFGLVLRFLRNR